jgi:O-antigen ligase
MLNSIEGQKYFYRVGEKAPAHAGWITVLTENGVIGVALLAAFILSFSIVSLGRRRPRTLGIGLFASVTLAVAFTSSDVSQMGLWFLAAGVITLIRRSAPGQPARAFARQAWRSQVVRRTKAFRY